MRAYEGSEHADGEELTPWMTRKLGIELAGKRATLAETGAWTELSRMYVRDLLSFEVNALGDGTRTSQQSTTVKADTMRASDKMDCCNIEAALQIRQTSVRTAQNTQTAAEVHSLVAVDTDEHEIARIKMQCAAVKQAAAKFTRPPAKLVERMAREVVLAAEPGPSGWRNADIAADGRSEGGPAVLREWIGTWTRAMIPHSTAKLWTAATIAPLDCGPKEPEPGQQMPQPCQRKLRPLALAEVLMKLAESCVIEQHIGSLLNGMEPTNLGLGTPDAAAPIVRIVRGWANDMAVAPKVGQGGKCLRSRTACHSLQRFARRNRSPVTQSSGSGATMAVDSTTRGGWQGSRAMQVMFVLRLEFALSKSDDLAPREITRIGMQDDMTFIGSAAALNRSWSTIEGWPTQVADSVAFNAEYWRLNLNSFELPMEVRNLCLKIPRKRHGVSLLWLCSERAALHACRLGQPAEAPTQTIERVEKALTTLQSIQRCSSRPRQLCEGVLMNRGVAHALNYDFRLVPPFAMAPLQRRLGNGLRQAEMSLSWHRSGPNFPRAVVAWVSG